jgi:putative transposase
VEYSTETLRKELPMRQETEQRKQTLAGLRAMAGADRMLGTLVRVISSGKQALDAVMLEMGRMVAESIMLMEREETAGPDYYPTDSALKKWAHEDGSIFLGDQKVKVTRPRLRHVTQGEVTLHSYAQMRAPGAFSEELLEKILRGVSAQRYADTVLHAAGAFGVSSSTVSRKIVELTAQKLKEFQERSLADFTPFAVFLDTIHRGGEAFLVALGVDQSGEKRALGFWQGSSENHEICEALFRDLEHRGLALSTRILFVTDGGSGLIKALRARFGKKLVHQRCAIHKSRNLQRHLAKPSRKEAHRRLLTALEQTSYADARRMLLELEAWLRAKNESAAESLREAFEELLTLHRLKVPLLLRKTLLSTNPIESMFSLVRHSERNLKRTRGSAMLQRWLGTTLLYCEGRFKRVKGYAEIAQVMATMEAVHAEPPLVQTKKAA